MKKRLLSMLMAVLMIASLVPATALAAPTCDHADTFSYSVKMDASAKQPGVTVKVCNTCGEILKADVVPFAELSVIQKCEKTAHEWKTVELQKASCTTAGVKLTYCAVCGTAGNEVVAVEEAKGHVYNDFTVVVKPTCQEDGWGYALCENCKNPVFVANAAAAVALLPENHTYAKETAVYAMFAAVNPEHTDYDALVAVTEKTKIGDVTLYPASEAKHSETVGGQYVYKNVPEAVMSNGYWNVVWNRVDVDKTHGGVDYTGDKYCPYCKEIFFGEYKNNKMVLNDLHERAMTIKDGDEGYYPYLDKEGNKHDGMTDKVWCETCKTYFGGNKLPYDEFFTSNPEYEFKVGQTYTIPAIAPTCTETGWTAMTITYTDKGWAVTAAGEEVPALGHHWAKVADIPATCDKPGYEYDNVEACDRVINEDGDTCDTLKPGTDYNQGRMIAPLHANASAFAYKQIVAPTCKTRGLSVKMCPICGEYAIDKDGDPVFYYVPAVSHVAGDPVNAKEATCTEVGYTGDKVCKWCGIVMEKGKEIPMKEHTVVDVAAVEATCTTDGMTAGTKCSVCGTVLTGCEVVKALGHDFKDGKCTRCGEKDPNYVAPEFKDAASIRDYAKDAVAWAAKEGIVKGDDNGNFLPTADITRQDFVTMLWRLKGSVASEKALTFGDKADIKDYAQTAVAWAVENGYIKGRDNGNFDPAAKITRAEIVAILNRIAENAKAEKAADFTDIATHWAKDAIAWAAEAGIVNGVGNNMFAPNDNASRQDTVVMLYKFVNLK